MQLWFGDYESHFSKDYSLSRGGATTESYIRHPEFRAHGMGYRDPGGHYGWVTHNDLPYFYKSIDWSKSAFGCHHAHFDAAILAYHYGVHPKLIVCTKAMGNMVLPRQSKRLSDLAKFYGLSDKSVPYNLFMGMKYLPPHIEKQVADGCLQDVYLNYEIFCRMMRGDKEKGLPPFPTSELEVISNTVKLFTRPSFEIDVPGAEQLALEAKESKETLLDRLGVEKEVLSSRECFADLLRELGVEPPMKLNKKGDKLTYAFGKSDAQFKELLEGEDDDVAALCAAKLGISSTIGETRALRIASMGRRGPAMLYINYAGAHTLRPSGGDRFNALNMPRDGKLRKRFRAPKGYKVVVADENAIECRLVNYLAGNARIVEKFRKGEDVYCDTAQSIYSRPINKDDDPFERFVGKTVELGSGYGLSWKTYRAKMATGAMGGGKVVKLTEEEAQRHIAAYRSTHDPVIKYWGQGNWALDKLMVKEHATWGPMELKDGYIFLPDGSFLDYTSLHERAADPDQYGRIRQEKWVTRRNGSSRAYGAKTVENVTQGLAWVIVKSAWTQLARDGVWVVLTPYDEIVALAPEREAEATRDHIVEVMSRDVWWAPGLPVKAEASPIADAYSKG